MNSGTKNIKQRKKRIWRSFVTVLASIVVFVTTYALIIPAITWERTLICEIPEHTHSENCYSDGVLVCDQIEHIHTASCFDAPKAIAKLYICGKPEHTHTEDCYFTDGTLKCTLEEHKHSTVCLALTANKSVSAAPKNTVILACSDVQEPSNSYLYSNGDYTAQAELLDNIMSQVRTTYPAVTDFFCGGDYNFDITRADNQYKENNKTKTYTSSLAANRTQQDAEWLSNEILKNFPTVGNIVLTQGNHDQFCNALTPTGGYNMGSYSVYVINEGDYPSGGSSQYLCQQTADGLRSWLNGLVQTNYNKPVFILTHVPLHYSNRVARDSDAIYAQLLYDAIAAYGDDLNIVFLYGHDHGAGDDDYLGGASVFLTRGDTITIAQAGSTSNKIEKTLNFTYMNYGYVGYFWDLWNQSQGPINYATDYALTMTTFEISGSDVIISRWDENGRHILKEAGAASLGLRGVPDSLPPDTKTYASPQRVYSPKNSQVEFQTIEDDTGVTITAICSSVTVEKMGSVTELDNAGITDYLAFDISVENLEGSATVTMPTRPGYNTVWHVNAGGELETISNAEFDGYTVTFTADGFSPFGSGKSPDSTPDTPDEPVSPDSIEDLLTFTKTEVPTSVTDGTATGTENVHTITLDIVPPEQKKVAVLMLIDATSSMYLQCANCGVELDYHAGGAKAGQPFRTTNWDGNTVSYYACDHFVERHDIAYSAASAFINHLAASGNQVYIKLVPFGNIALTDYTGWLDLSQSGKVAEAQTALGNIQNISGTDISNVLRKACDIISNDLAPGMSSEDTYVLLLTDGCQAVNDTNVPAEALTSSYIQKWKNIWSTYTHYDEVLIDQNGGPTPAGYYIAAPYYAEQIEDDAGLNSHLYSVMLGQCIDNGNRNRNNNWLYTPGIGITAQDYVKSFSDYSSFITDVSGMNDYYTMVSNQLISVLLTQTLTVTDPMSDYVDFLGFTDANGQSLLSNPTEAAYNTGTRTITWEPVTADSDGHYRLYYNVRIKTEAEGFVDGQLYPANKTTTATYTLQYPDGHTEEKQKCSDIPEIAGMLGQLSFTKISANETPLSGAQFKLVHDINCPYCHGATFGDITFGSDANGNVSVSNIPSGHTYKLFETSAPDGYLPFEGSLDVVVSYGNVTVSGAADVWNNECHYLIDPPATVKLTITKEVVGVTGIGNFPFEVVLSDGDGNPVLLPTGAFSPENSVAYTIAADGKITFTLGHQQSIVIGDIPYGAVAAIAEINHNGFTVAFTDNNGYVKYSSNDSIELKSDREITVKNMPGSVLPETGGIGTTTIYVIGALLMLGALTIGHVLWRRREGRGDV